MTNIEAARLAAAIAILRPDWPPASIQTFITRELTSRPYFDVGVALTWIALDPDTKTPRRALEAGPWWTAIARSTVDKPVIEPCPIHGAGISRRTDTGQCGDCWADQHQAAPVLERPRTPPPAPLRQLAAAGRPPAKTGPQPQADQPVGGPDASR